MCNAVKQNQTKIDATQLHIVQSLIQLLNVKMSAFCKYFKIKHLHELDIDAYAQAIKFLNLKYKIKNNIKNDANPNDLLIGDSDYKNQKIKAHEKINFHLQNIAKTMSNNNKEVTL